MKIYYKILDNRVVMPWIKVGDTYYILTNFCILSKKRGAIRKKILEILENPLFVSYICAGPLHNPPFGSINIDSEVLKDRLHKLDGPYYDGEKKLLEALNEDIL